MFSRFVVLACTHALQAVLNKISLIYSKPLTAAAKIKEGVAMPDKDGRQFSCRLGHQESARMRGIGTTRAVKKQDSQRRYIAHRSPEEPSQIQVATGNDDGLCAATSGVMLLPHVAVSSTAKVKNRDITTNDVY